MKDKNYFKILKRFKLTFKTTKIIFNINNKVIIH